MMLRKMNYFLFILSVFLLFPAIPVYAVNTTPAGSPFIQINPSSTSIEIGDPLVIEGVVSNTIMGATPGNVILIVKAPISSRLDAFNSVPLTNDGTFSYQILTDVTGTWVISARYGDETSAVSEVKVISRETTKKSLNILSSRGSPAHVYDDIEMSGYLKDKQGAGIANKEVQYMVAIPPYGCSICSENDDTLIWQIYGTAYTDSSGHYSFSFPVYDHGQYRVKSIYNGDDIYQGSTSETRSVQVI